MNDQSLQDEFYDCFILAQDEERSSFLLKRKKEELLKVRKQLDKTLRIINLSLAIKGEKDVLGIKKKV